MDRSIRTILVATDFGESAERAIALGRSLAERLGARLTLVHVCAVPAPSARRELDHQVLAIRMSGGDADGILETGEPCERIVAAAQAQGADLIVVGTHRRGLSRFVTTSVAAAVVRTSPVPVLTATVE